MKDKKYSIPRDLAESMDEAAGVESTIICLAKHAATKKKEFWNGVYEIYPELDIEDLKLSYNSRTRAISVLKMSS